MPATYMHYMLPALYSVYTVHNAASSEFAATHAIYSNELHSIATHAAVKRRFFSTLRNATAITTLAINIITAAMFATNCAWSCAE